MKTWEYFTYTQEKPIGNFVESPTKYFNQLGVDGWELVTAFVTDAGQTVAYFKREIIKSHT